MSDPPEKPRSIVTNVPLGTPKQDRTFEILLRAMQMLGGMNTLAADAYRNALKLAITAASLEGAQASVRTYESAIRDLDQHLATVPNKTPPGAA